MHLLSIAQLVLDKGKFSMQDCVCNVAELDADLYRKNIIPSPSCSCGDFESAHHFFYLCPQLTAVRERYMVDALRNHTTHDFLCWKPEFHFF